MAAAHAVGSRVYHVLTAGSLQAVVDEAVAVLAGTVATDAELAAAVATLNTAIGLKQDASTAATDAEVAAAVATLNGAITAEASARASADSALDAAKQSTSEKAQANGYAGLGADAKVPSAQLPAIAITSVSVVASQAAQLALTAQEGDVAVRSDQGKSYVHNGGSAGSMADWTELQTPADAVLSVAGRTGAVTLVKGDVGLGNVENTSDASKPVSTAQQAALDAKQDAATAATDAELGSEASTRAAADSALDTRLDSVEAGGAWRESVPDNPRMLAPDSQQLHGSNVVPKSTDVGWRTFYRDWDWAGWVKPQIDRVADAGGNAIRMIGDVGGVIWGMNTRALYLSRWEQFIEHCRDRGLWVYVVGGAADANAWEDVLDSGSDRPSDAQIAAEVAALASATAKYENVVALDGCQEINFATGYNDAAQAALADAIANAVRAEVPSLPITFSYGGMPGSGWAATTFFTNFNPIVDFFDFHAWPETPLLNPNLAAYFAAAEKPLVIGEFGSAKSNSDATRNAAYDHWKTYAGRPEIAGSFSWAIQDQSASAASNYGMWDNAGAASSVLTRWQGIPTRRLKQAGQRVRGCMIKRTTAQDIASGAEVAIIWEAENWDTDGFWTSGAPTRITIPTDMDGAYDIIGKGVWDNNSLLTRVVGFRKNGAGVTFGNDRRGAALFSEATAIAPNVDLVAGDYIELVYYQDSGTTRTAGSAAGYPELLLRRVGTRFS